MLDFPVSLCNYGKSYNYRVWSKNATISQDLTKMSPHMQNISQKLPLSIKFLPLSSPTRNVAPS
jgi:hypothetical protein